LVLFRIFLPDGSFILSVSADTDIGIATRKA
jgi:hypothetical protein